MAQTDLTINLVAQMREFERALQRARGLTEQYVEFTEQQNRDLANFQEKIRNQEITEIRRMRNEEMQLLERRYRQERERARGNVAEQRRLEQRYLAQRERLNNETNREIANNRERFVERSLREIEQADRRSARRMRRDAMKELKRQYREEIRMAEGNADERLRIEREYQRNRDRLQNRNRRGGGGGVPNSPGGAGDVDQTTGALGRLRGMITPVTAGLAAIGIAAVAMGKKLWEAGEKYNKFIDGTLKIQTLLTPEQAKSVPNSMNKLREVSKATGVELESLQTTMYNVVSGVSGMSDNLDAAAKLTEVATNAAKGLGAETEDVAFTMASTANAIGINIQEMENQERVAGVLAKTMQQGVIKSGQELASSFAQAAPSVKQLFSDSDDALTALSAMTVQLTKSGKSVAEAQTVIKAFSAELLDATKREKLFGAGLQGVDQATGKITDLDAMIKSMASNTTEMYNAMGSKEAKTGLAILTDNADSFLETINTISQEGGQTYRSMSETMARSSETSAQRMKRAYDDMMISLGESSGGIITGLQEASASVMTWLGDVFKTSKQEFSESMSEFEQITNLADVSTDAFNQLSTALKAGMTLDASVLRGELLSVSAALEDMEDMPAPIKKEVEEMLNIQGELTIEQMERMKNLLGEIKEISDLYAASEGFELQAQGAEALNEIIGKQRSGFLNWIEETGSAIANFTTGGIYGDASEAIGGKDIEKAFRFDQIVKQSEALNKQTTELREKMKQAFDAGDTEKYRELFQQFQSISAEAKLQSDRMENIDEAIANQVKATMDVEMADAKREDRSVNIEFAYENILMHTRETNKLLAESPAYQEKVRALVEEQGVAYNENLEAEKQAQKEAEAKAVIEQTFLEMKGKSVEEQQKALQHLYTEYEVSKDIISEKAKEAGMEKASLDAQVAKLQVQLEQAKALGFVTIAYQNQLRAQIEGLENQKEAILIAEKEAEIQAKVNKLKFDESGIQKAINTGMERLNAGQNQSLETQIKTLEKLKGITEEKIKDLQSQENLTIEQRATLANLQATFNQIDQNIDSKNEEVRIQNLLVDATNAELQSLEQIAAIQSKKLALEKETLKLAKATGTITEAEYNAEMLRMMDEEIDREKKKLKQLEKQKATEAEILDQKLKITQLEAGRAGKASSIEKKAQAEQAKEEQKLQKEREEQEKRAIEEQKRAQEARAKLNQEIIDSENDRIQHNLKYMQRERELESRKQKMNMQFIHDMQNILVDANNRFREKRDTAIQDIQSLFTDSANSLTAAFSEVYSGTDSAVEMIREMSQQNQRDQLELLGTVENIQERMKQTMVDIEANFNQIRGGTAFYNPNQAEMDQFIEFLARQANSSIESVFQNISYKFSQATRELSFEEASNKLFDAFDANSENQRQETIEVFKRLLGIINESNKMIETVPLKLAKISDTNLTSAERVNAMANVVDEIQNAFKATLTTGEQLTAKQLLDRLKGWAQTGSGDEAVMDVLGRLDQVIDPLEETAMNFRSQIQDSNQDLQAFRQYFMDRAKELRTLSFEEGFANIESMIPEIPSSIDMNKFTELYNQFDQLLTSVTGQTGVTIEEARSAQDEANVAEIGKKFLKQRAKILEYDQKRLELNMQMGEIAEKVDIDRIKKLEREIFLFEQKVDLSILDYESQQQAEEELQKTRVSAGAELALYQDLEKQVEQLNKRRDEQKEIMFEFMDPLIAGRKAGDELAISFLEMGGAIEAAGYIMNDIGELYKTQIGDLSTLEDVDFSANIVEGQQRINSALEDTNKSLKTQIKEISDYYSNYRDSILTDVNALSNSWQEAVNEVNEARKALAQIQKGGDYNLVKQFNNIKSKVMATNNEIKGLQAELITATGSEKGIINARIAELERIKTIDTAKLAAFEKSVSLLAEQELALNRTISEGQQNIAQFQAKAEEIKQHGGVNFRINMETGEFREIFDPESGTMKEIIFKPEFEQAEEIEIKAAIKLNEEQIKADQQKIIDRVKKVASELEKVAEIPAEIGAKINSLRTSILEGDMEAIAEEGGDLSIKVGKALLEAPPPLNIAGAVILGVGIVAKAMATMAKLFTNEQRSAKEIAEEKAEADKRSRDLMESQLEIAEQLADIGDRTLDQAKERLQDLKDEIALERERNKNYSEYMDMNAQQLANEKRNTQNEIKDLQDKIAYWKDVDENMNTSQRKSLMEQMGLDPDADLDDYIANWEGMLARRENDLTNINNALEDRAALYALEQEAMEEHTDSLRNQLDLMLKTGAPIEDIKDRIDSITKVYRDNMEDVLGSIGIDVSNMSADEIEDYLASLSEAQLEQFGPDVWDAINKYFGAIEDGNEVLRNASDERRRYFEHLKAEIEYKKEIGEITEQQANDQLIKVLQDQLDYEKSVLAEMNEQNSTLEQRLDQQETLWDIEAEIYNLKHGELGLDNELLQKAKELARERSKMLMSGDYTPEDLRQVEAEIIRTLREGGASEEQIQRQLETFRSTIPQYEIGGRIIRDQLAMLHGGESILNPQATRTVDQMFPGFIDAINANDPKNAMEAMLATAANARNGLQMAQIQAQAGNSSIVNIGDIQVFAPSGNGADIASEIEKMIDRKFAGQGIQLGRL